jgi:hypothetical protein
MADLKTEAKQALEAHGRSIDALHEKLVAMVGTNKARLAQSVDKYKAAHQSFQDDALAMIGLAG